MVKLVSFNWGDVRAIFEIQFSLWSDSFKKNPIKGCSTKNETIPIHFHCVKTFYFRYFRNHITHTKHFTDKTKKRSLLLNANNV